MLNSPMLVRTPEHNIVIETGVGNKLSDKQKKIFQISPDWDIPGGLEAQGLSRDDIDFCILTHCDFDHVGGAVMFNEQGETELTFPRAKYIVQKLEWEDALNPNIRSANTYLAPNFEGLEAAGQLVIVEGAYEGAPGVHLVLTGGHTRGHQVVWLESGGEVALHMADLLPTHAHHNPLWVMAFDNYPMDVIAKKQELHAEAEAKDAWYIFFHDPYLKACKFGQKGEVTNKVD